MKILTLIFALIALFLLSSPSGLRAELRGDEKIIEWVNSEYGVFSNLMCAVEWMYCVKHNENFWRLYVNMNGAYGYNGNAFSALFKPFQDPQISTDPLGTVISLQTTDYPKCFSAFDRYPTDGMKDYESVKYVHGHNALYKNPDFSIFRERIHSMILQYVQPAADLQKKIDTILEKMNNQSASSQRTQKIGIHVRCLRHYVGCRKSPAQFIYDVEKDIDQMMASKDSDSTQIFLATLLEPLVERLSAKYNVVVCDIPRDPDVTHDWSAIAYADPLDRARDAIVDTWCLANCDELWCGSSNMTTFAACINPRLKICMLPSLEKYHGS